MTQLKLKEKSFTLTKKDKEFLVHYGLSKQEVLDKQKTLSNMKPLILELFEKLNTSMLEVSKVKVSKSLTVDAKICKITKESSYALKGDGTKLLDANKNPILISGRVDTKKLKEKYPHIWADCLVPTKSVEVRYEIKEFKNAK